MFNYCKDHKITSTRSRPYTKNDGAHVEQKYWVRGRELAGYLRYDTPAGLAKLNEIWDLDRFFTNFPLLQQKLVSKQRYGAKVIKYYDVPATPHQRAVIQPTVKKRAVITMNSAFKRIKPTHLQREILSMTSELKKLSPAKKIPPVKPPVSIWWNKNHQRKFLNEATTQLP